MARPCVGTVAGLPPPSPLVAVLRSDDKAKARTSAKAEVHRTRTRPCVVTVAGLPQPSPLVAVLRSGDKVKGRSRNY